MTRFAAIGLALALPLLGGWDWLRSSDENVDSGNQRYSQGAFLQAADAYQRALDGGGDRARVHFDIGTALYKLAEAEQPGNERTKLLDRAESEFRFGADTADTVLRSGAYHNLGNTHFARERYADAIDAYKKALRANPNNDDARYNLELALRKLKQDKAAKQQQPQPDSSGGQQGTPGQGGQPQPGQGQPDQPPPGQTPPQPGGNGAQPGQTPAPPEQAPPEQAPPEPGQPGAASGQTPQTGSDPGADGKPAGGDKKSPGDDKKAPGDPGSGQRGGSPAPDPRSESERKLEELERQSRETRRRQLRNRAHSSGNSALQLGKDW